MRDMEWIAAVVRDAVLLSMERMGSASYGLAGLGVERAERPVRSALDRTGGPRCGWTWIGDVWSAMDRSVVAWCVVV